MFKKIFKIKKKSIYKIDDLLNQNTFLNLEIQPDFFSALLELHTKDINDHRNPLHINFNLIINQLVDAQIPLFENILAANFSSEALDGFITYFEQNIKIKVVIPAANMYFISYWFQVLKKLNDEVVMSSLNDDLIKRFKSFYNKFENLARYEYEQLSNENRNRFE